MKTQSIQTLSRLGCSLTLAALVSAPLTVVAEVKFKMQVHPRETTGTWALVNHQYDEAIAYLEGDRAKSNRHARNWGSILNNLCVAYTKVDDFEQATEYCDWAVEEDENLGIAYNNRGVLAALKQDFASAVVDFDTASARKASVEYATHNIQYLGEHVSEFQGDSPNNNTDSPRA